MLAQLLHEQAARELSVGAYQRFEDQMSKWSYNNWSAIDVTT